MTTTTLTIIPGYDDNDLTQVRVRYLPTTHEQTVEYWEAEVGETRSSVMDNMENPITIHSVTLAHLAAGSKGNGTLLEQVAWTRFAAKETLELIKASGIFQKGRSAADDNALFDIDDNLALFENLPEIGREKALTGISTHEYAFPTCLEETSFYWNSDLVDEDEAMAARERATNPKVIAAIGASS